MQTYPLRRSRFQRHRPGEGDCKAVTVGGPPGDYIVSAPSPRGRGLQDSVDQVSRTPKIWFQRHRPGEGDGKVSTGVVERAISAFQRHRPGEGDCKRISLVAPP